MIDLSKSSRVEASVTSPKVQVGGAKSRPIVIDDDEIIDASDSEKSSSVTSIHHTVQFPPPPLVSKRRKPATVLRTEAENLEQNEEDVEMQDIEKEKSSSKSCGMYDWDEVDSMKYFSLDLEAIAPKPIQIFEDEDKLAWICNICAQPWPGSQRQIVKHMNSNIHRNAAKAILIYENECSTTICIKPFKNKKPKIKKKKKNEKIDYHPHSLLRYLNESESSCDDIDEVSTQSEQDLIYCSICQDYMSINNFLPKQMQLSQEGRSVWCKVCYPLVSSERQKVIEHLPKPISKSSFMLGCQRYFDCKKIEFNEALEAIFLLSGGRRSPQTFANVFSPFVLNHIKDNPVKIIKLILNEFHECKIRERVLFRKKDHVYKDMVRQCGACGECKTASGFQVNQWDGPSIVSRASRLCLTCSKTKQPRRCSACANVKVNFDFPPESRNFGLEVPAQCLRCTDNKVPIHPYLVYLMKIKVQCHTCRKVQLEGGFGLVPWRFLHLSSKANCTKCIERMVIRKAKCSACDKTKRRKEFPDQRLLKSNLPTRCTECVQNKLPHKYLNQSIIRISCSCCSLLRTYGEYDDDNRFDVFPVCRYCTEKNKSFICNKCGITSDIYIVGLLLTHNPLCRNCAQRALCFDCNEIKYEYQYDDESRMMPFGRCMECNFQNKPYTLDFLPCQSCQREQPVENFTVRNIWKLRLGLEYRCKNCDLINS